MLALCVHVSQLFLHSLDQADLILLRFRYCIYYKLNVCGNSASSKSVSAIFTTASTDHFMSLCHILVILAIFQTFFTNIISVTLICDPWSLLLLLWLAKGSDDG